MEFLRGLGKFFGSFLFTTFLVLAILFMQLVNFTGYQNFNSIAGGILEQHLFSQVTDSNLSDIRNLLTYQCSTTDRVNVPIGGDLQVVLKCDDVRSSDNVKLKSLITSALTESVYNKNYNCSFLNCIKSSNKEDLLFVMSHQGNLFYKNMLAYMWIGTAVSLAVLLASIRTWPGRLKGVGFNLAATGMPFLLFGFIEPLILKSVPSETLSTAQPIIDGLTSDLKNLFMAVLVAGVVLVVAGYALGIYLSKKSKPRMKK